MCRGPGVRRSLMPLGEKEGRSGWRIAREGDKGFEARLD